MRLFWAVNLSPPVRAAVGAFQARLRETGANAKWVEQENLHLTVKFLGETPPGRVPDMVRAVRGAVGAIPAFDLRLSGCGVFGRPPRVLWVGVQGATEQFAILAREVEQALVPFGYRAESRKVTPHLTVARWRSPAGAKALAARARGLASADFGGVRVDRVDLMQSVLGRGGPQYTVLDSVFLYCDH